MFLKIWRTFCSDIVIMKPKSDLCAICQKNYTSHSQLRGASDEDKADFSFKCQEHLRRVDIERAAYKSLIKRTVDEFDIKKLRERKVENILLTPMTGIFTIPSTLPNKYTYPLTLFNLGLFTF